MKVGSFALLSHAALGSGNLDRAMVRDMVFETSIGWAYLCRLALLLTAAIIVLRARKTSRWRVAAFVRMVETSYLHTSSDCVDSHVVRSPYVTLQVA